MKNRLFPILTAFNTNVAGTSSASEMQLLRQAVRVAEQQLGQVPQEDEGNPNNDCLREASTAARLAKANWQTVWEASHRIPGVVKPCELERLYLIAEITQLSLAETRVAVVQSELSRVQSQLQELGEQVRGLRDRVEILTMRN